MAWATYVKFNGERVIACTHCHVLARIGCGHASRNDEVPVLRDHKWQPPSLTSSDPEASYSAGISTLSEQSNTIHAQHLKCVGAFLGLLDSIPLSSRAEIMAELVALDASFVSVRVALQDCITRANTVKYPFHD